MNGIKQLSTQSWKRAAAACAVILAMAMPGWAQGAQHANRITRDLGSGGLVRLPGSVHRLTRKAADLGLVNRGMLLNSLSMQFGPSAEQQIELDALSLAQQDPKSPQYHKWLTQEEYGARFGLSDADLSKVTEWLQSQGFTVRGVSKSRNALHFSGTALQVESAFHTHLHRYQLDGKEHFANATELQVPEGLRGVLLMVRGLNNFRPKPASVLRTQPIPNFTLDASQHFLTPGDWATIYNVDAIYNAGFTGTGAFVGVVGQTYLPKSDIDNFRSAAGLSATKLTFVCIHPSSFTCTNASAISDQGDLAEADLDIEWAGGIAKNATVVYLYAPYSVVGTAIDPVTSQYYDVFDALQHAVSEYTVPATGKVLPVISMSYTDCEQTFNGQPGYVTWVGNLGEQASSQGQTIVVSSGDAGVAGCDFQVAPATRGVSATVPVDSPNYTGVGGTTLIGDESDYAQYWNQTPWNSTTNIVKSALQYIPETVWNDSTSSSLAAGGSGVSLYFPQPDWQPTPINYSGPSGRFVPDVSFAASGNHDGYMFCSSEYNSAQYGTMCADGFFSSGGSSGLQVFYPVGGTSAGAPSFAAMLTLLVQKYGALGNINPILYGMATNSATYAAVFHDITSGNNNVPCVFGTTGCVGGSPSMPGTMGYSATTGYDLTTGLGSINGGALYTALASVIEPPTTTTTLAAQPNPVALNSTTTLTATISSTKAGTITGTVTFSSPTRVLGSNTVSGGKATRIVTASAANGLGKGTDLVTASYSGDSNFPASSGSVALTVYDPAAPALELSLTTASPVVAGGGSFTLTVNGANFTSNSKVLWNGAVRTTTYVSSTKLTATILAADIAQEGTALVTVSRPLPGGKTSAAQPFAVMSATPVAKISGGSLTEASDASGNHVLTLTGTDFIPASVVRWNGASLTTSLASPWQISAVVTGAQFGSRPAVVTVTNPSGGSAGFTLP